MMQDRFKIFDKLFHHSLHDNSIVVFHVLGDHHRRFAISSKWGHQTSLEDRPDIIGSIEGSSLEIENTLINLLMGFHYKILIKVYTPKPEWPWKKWPTDSRQCQGHHLHSQLLPTPLYTKKIGSISCQTYHSSFLSVNKRTRRTFRWGWYCGGI